jgi:hypothetical protein
MLSADRLKAAVEAIRKCKLTSRAQTVANLRGNAPATSTTRRIVVPGEEDLTRAELADYMDRAGWDPDNARELAAIERAVDFGNGLTSKQLEVLTDLLLSTPEAEMATLQLDTVEIVARWLLRKGRAVGPDGGTIFGVRTLDEARRIVGGWFKERIARRNDTKPDEAEAPVTAHEFSAQTPTGISATPKARSGRPARLAADFVDFAGGLWLNAKRQNPGSRSGSKALSKATNDELAAIASSLDSKNYIPPAKYLERQFAHELMSYNSRNSNSKAGAIKTWSQLVSVADKDHLRGMRRLLSRCAEKSKLLGPVPSSGK